MFRPRFSATALLCATLSAGLTAAGFAQEKDPAVEAVRRELSARCERELASDSEFFGQSELLAIERRLEVPSTDSRITAQELLKLAWEEVRLGRHESALSRLEKANGLLVDVIDSDPKAREIDTLVLMLRGIAHFQLAENLNCVDFHNPAACILPIGPDAVHPKPEQSRVAGDLFRRVVERNPDFISAHWMFVLSRMLTGSYPQDVPPDLRLPPGTFADETIPGGPPPLPRLINVGRHLGLHGEDFAGGAILEDFDGDGLLDIVTSSWHPCTPMQAYRNTGEGFQDVSELWGLDAILGGLNTLQADYDNDGDRDILLLRGAWQGPRGKVRNSLLRNDLSDGGGFVDVAARAGLAYPAFPTQAAAWGDYDLDGDLDLVIANEAVDIVIDASAYRNVVDRSYPLQLFKNDGGVFRDVSKSVGLDRRSFGKGVAWGDIDNDGDLDLYVSNLGPNQLYRNDREEGFVDVSHLAGPGLGDRRTFATWFFDQNNDGWLDLFVASYNLPVDAISANYLGLDYRRADIPANEQPVSTPVLLRNDGEQLTDVSASVGFTTPMLIMGSNYGDLDNDGEHDLYFGTGMPDFTAMSPNVFYRGWKDRFVDQTYGIGLGHLQKGHGVAFGDLDNDGDQDLLQQLGGAYPADSFENALYLNPLSESDDPPRFLSLDLVGTTANRDAIGARVAVSTRDADGNERTLHRVVGSGSSFGASSLRLEMGLARATEIDGVVIRWPDGSAPVTYRNLELDAFYEITQGKAPRRLRVERTHLGHTGSSGH
ncbi:MAG: VCBS repeat-containing protein [Acidobacteriota bacterium]